MMMWAENSIQHDRNQQREAMAYRHKMKINKTKKDRTNSRKIDEKFRRR